MSRRGRDDVEETGLVEKGEALIEEIEKTLL